MKPLLGCGTCGAVHPHVFAYRVPGVVDQSTGEWDERFKLKGPQEVVPMPEKKATVVEQVWMCIQCGTLRRWGLEVFDGEARGDRVRPGGAGESGGGGHGQSVVEEPSVPEEEVEARAIRVERSTGPSAA